MAPTSEQASRLLPDIARRLLTFAKDRLSPRIKDVFGFASGEDEVVFAFSGAPEAVLAAKTRELDNPMLPYDRKGLGAFDHEIAQVLGLWGRDQFVAASHLPVDEWVMGVEEAIRQRFIQDTEVDDLPMLEVRLAFTPEPGYPWRENQRVRYVSGKTGRWHWSRRPGWVTVGRFRDHEFGSEVTGLVAEPCYPGLMPLSSDPNRLAVQDGAKAVRLALPRFPMTSYVTHAFTIGSRDWAIGSKRETAAKDTAKAIRKCGGFLFPSYAVGPVPATNFGPLVLVMRAGTILPAFRPWRGRGQKRVAVYRTDAWTTSIGRIMQEEARALFEELTAVPRWPVRDHLAIMGPPLVDYVAATEVEDPIAKTPAQVGAALRSLFDIWGPTLSLPAFLERSRAYGAERYAYVEAKASEIVSVDEVAVAVAPDWYARECRLFLNRLGRPDVPLLEVSGVLRGAYFTDDDVRLPLDEQQYEAYRYAWCVREALEQTDLGDALAL